MTITRDDSKFFSDAERTSRFAAEVRPVSQGRPTGTLRIGSIESAAAARLPSLLSSYHGSWPEVDIDLVIGTSRSLLDDVVSGHLDCAFVAIANSDISTGATLRSLERHLGALHAYEEELMLITPPTHPPATNAGALTVNTMAAFAHGCAYRSVLEGWLERSAAARADWKVTEQESYDAMLACVAAGLCFAACPRSVLNLRCAPVNVKTRTITWVGTYLVYRHLHGDAALDALLDTVRQTAEATNAG